MDDASTVLKNRCFAPIALLDLWRDSDAADQILETRSERRASQVGSTFR
jgi:hypothetical protein